MKKIILLSLVMFSCSEQRLIKKAEQRVLLNQKSFNDVGLAWAKLNPVDTTITKVISRSDTLILTDTFSYNHFDTLNRLDTVFTVIKKVIRIHDTLYTYIQDNRVLSSYKDSIQSYKNSLFVVNNSLLISNNSLLESKKQTSKYRWYFFGLLALIVLILFLSIYFKRFI